MKKRILVSAMAASVLFAAKGQAIEFDGFLTAGLAVHDQDNITYLDGVTKDVSFDNDSKFGLQVTSDISADMKAVAQLLAAGADNNYAMDIEWAYLDYAITDNFSLRGGKVKQPVFLISDYFEVGYAYPWIRPPQEVYRNNPINTIVGMEALYQINFSKVSITLQPYLGSNSEAVPGTGGTVTFNAENFVGMALMANTRSFTFQMSYMQTDVQTIVAADPSSVFNSSGSATLASVGLSWDLNNFVGYTEYVTRDITNDNGNPMEALFPDQDGYYVTLGYRIGKYLPHITVANSEYTAFPSGNPGVSQDSITLGLRYELNDSAALKMEYQSIEPLSATEPGLFNSVIADNKANMLSVAIDVIF